MNNIRHFIKTFFILLALLAICNEALAQDENPVISSLFSQYLLKMNTPDESLYPKGGYSSRIIETKYEIPIALENWSDAAKESLLKFIKSLEKDHSAADVQAVLDNLLKKEILPKEDFMIKESLFLITPFYINIENAVKLMVTISRQIAIEKQNKSALGHFFEIFLSFFMKKRGIRISKFGHNIPVKFDDREKGTVLEADLWIELITDNQEIKYLVEAKCTDFKSTLKHLEHQISKMIKAGTDRTIDSAFIVSCYKLPADFKNLVASRVERGKKGDFLGLSILSQDEKGGVRKLPGHFNIGLVEEPFKDKDQLSQMFLLNFNK